MAFVRMSVLALVCLLPVSGFAGWTLNVSPQTSSDGVFRVHWEGPDVKAGLQLSTQGDFSHLLTVYAGEDRAALISGKPDGVYQYRLLDANGQVVARATATVKHHSLSRAWMFFAVGLLVFLATAVLVMRGARADDEVKS